MPPQIFVSHTKFDADFFDVLDNVAARLGTIKLYRSEYETILPPAWTTIQEELRKSRAVFLLVGKELVKAQAAADTSQEARENWKYTQNWISYEIGIACENMMDVWVLCDDVEINFPVPYLNNYVLHRDFNFYRRILDDYSKGKKYRTWRLLPTTSSLLRFHKLATRCPYDTCRAVFNLHTPFRKGERFTCPTCLKSIWLADDWLLSES